VTRTGRGSGEVYGRAGVGPFLEAMVARLEVLRRGTLQLVTRSRSLVASIILAITLTCAAWYMNLSKSHGWFECAFLPYSVAQGVFRPHAARALSP